MKTHTFMFDRGCRASRLLLILLMGLFVLPGVARPLPGLTTSERLRPITGIVTDENNVPLPGVSVLVKGTSRGTVTDAAGEYRLEIADGAVAGTTLVFSFVGYVAQEVTVGARAVISITLQADSKQLGEVVVIGYGTSRKSDLTGSVGSVKADQIMERPAPSLNQSLAGRMPGVQVNTNSGRPGGRTTIRIRGFSSINSSNNPLYVVDGVMLPQGNQNQFTNAIDFLNPNDIVSVEVLKDASSTAIYGARGANGVILISTKRGKSGEGQVTYNVDFSVPTIGPNRPQVLNAQEFQMVEDLTYKNSEKYDPAGWAAGKYAALNPALKRIDPRLFDASGKPRYDVDRMKDITQSVLSQNHQLGFSGGNERTQYSASLGYRDDQGLIKTSYLKRYSARFTLDDQVKRWLKVGGSLAYNNQSENVVDQNDQVARRMVEDFPFMPAQFPDGTYSNNRDYPLAEGTINALQQLDGRRYILDTQTLTGSLFTNISFTKDLQMKTVLGANVLSQTNNQWNSRNVAISQQGTASSSNRRETFWSLENYLTYTKNLPRCIPSPRCSVCPGRRPISLAREKAYRGLRRTIFSSITSEPGVCCRR